MKSKGLRLGSWHSRQDEPLQIDCTSESIIILGLTHKNLFHCGVDELEGYRTKTSNSIGSVEKERPIHLRESQSASKICHL